MLTTSNEKTAMQGLVLSLLAIVVYTVVRYSEALVFNQDLGFSTPLILAATGIVIGISILSALLAKNYLEALSFWVPMVLFSGFCVGTFLTKTYNYYIIAQLAALAICSFYQNFKRFVRFYIVESAIIIWVIFFVVRKDQSMFQSLLTQWLLSLLVAGLLFFLTKRSTDRLIESNDSMQSFYSFLRSTQNYTAIIDNTGHIKYISNSMMANFSKLQDTSFVTRRPIMDIFPSMKLKLCFLEIILNPELTMSKITAIEINNKTRYARISANRLYDRKTKSHISIFVDITDITEIYEAELEAERASEAKSSFLAKMSHEIRTPMNAIVGMSEIILKSEDEMSRDIFDNVMSIKQSGKNLLSIINDILDFSKIESGKMELLQADYEIASLFIDVVSIMRTNLMNRNIDFICYIDPHLPYRVRGDEVRARQIVTNILSNAAKYTRNGHISFSVTGDVIGDTIELSFAVKDTGLGIKPEDMGKLFGEFNQLDIEKNKEVSGTGLGLAISRNLARTMGGDIRVESEYAKGSTFTARIRQRIVDPKPLAQIEHPDEASHIVFYEPNPLKLESARRSFRSLGVQMQGVGDRESFSKLTGIATRMVFTVEDSLDATFELLKSRGLSVPVVLMTDYGAIVSRQQLSTLVLPIHSITIANLLNGTSTKVISPKHSERKPFTAPEVRALVVDDVTVNLRVAEGLLKPYKLKVDTASSGEDALNMVRRNAYDLIFMDHMMPGMDGIQCTKVIREMEKTKGTAPLPIIALTANAISGMREKFIADGLTDYLSKPIELDKLDDILNKYIPPDKRQAHVPQAKASTTQPLGLGDNKIKLSGVDTDAGLALNGSRENYLEMLRLYASDANKRLEFFEHPLQNPSASELLEFTTSVHALKSASAVIGATEVSELALGLEMAGKAGDLATINVGIGDFKDKLTQLIHEIAALEADTRQATANSGEVDKALVRKTIEAIEAEDISVIDACLVKLGNGVHSENLRDSIDKVSEAVLGMDYAEAATELRRILNE